MPQLVSHKAPKRYCLLSLMSIFMIGSAVWLKLILFAELWETPQHDILYERQRTECGERCHHGGRNGALRRCGRRGGGARGHGGWWDASARVASSVPLEVGRLGGGRGGRGPGRGGPPCQGPERGKSRRSADREANKSIMPLWVDKHRPKQLKDLDFHHDLSAQLQRMVQGSGDFPHTLIYGPSGAGKKTRVMALLRELHGPSVERLRVEQRTFKVGASATPVDLTLVCSSHHIELNPSDAGTRDRDVVQEVIKEIAQSAPILTGGSSSASAPTFKVVVLNEVERLSKPAQHGRLAE